MRALLCLVNLVLLMLRVQPYFGFKKLAEGVYACTCRPLNVCRTAAAEIEYE